MDALKRNPEKIALILVALVALGFGVKQILGAKAFPEQFELQRSTAKEEYPEIEQAKIQFSREIVSSPFPWPEHAVTLEGGGDKAVPLLRSVVVIEKDGELFDMQDPNEDPLRPPVSNEWLLKYRLDFLSSAVLDNDPDDDGYTTLEEWHGKSNPVDKASHPPYVEKLVFVEQKSRGFFLRFAANNKTSFGLNTRDNRGQRSSAFVAVGDSVANGRFTVLKYTEKEGQNAAGIRGDRSELEIKDNVTGKTFTLIKDEEKPWPTYFAQFDFVLDPSQREFFVREGDTFTLNLEPGVSYELIEVTESKAVIQPVAGGDPITLTRGANAAPSSSDDGDFF